MTDVGSFEARNFHPFFFTHFDILTDLQFGLVSHFVGREFKSLIIVSLPLLFVIILFNTFSSSSSLTIGIVAYW